MNKDLITDFIKYAVVASLGLYTFWNVTFFRPFSAAYPPAASYQTVGPDQQKPDSVWAAAGKQYHKSWFGEFWLGKHYRFLWTTPVKVKVLHLDREGLQVTKRGGGMQTTSFTLQDDEGREYALRSVDKDPISVIPPALWPSVLGSFIRDQVSATDPYALIPIMTLTEKAGLARAEVRLFFVLPDDPGFRAFEMKKSGMFCLTPKYVTPPGIGGKEAQQLKVLSSEEMLKAVRPGKKNAVDTLLYLKCRLFDLVIGDWDRHAGQWDWAAFPGQKHTVFKPLPKDRDQAFGYYADGVFPYILSRDFAAKKISTFSPEYEDIEGFSINGSDLDRHFLKTLPETVLNKVVGELQRDLNDANLQEALKQYPPSVYEKIRDQHFKTLQARRDQLPQAAREFLQIIKSRP